MFVANIRTQATAVVIIVTLFEILPLGTWFIIDRLGVDGVDDGNGHYMPLIHQVKHHIVSHFARHLNKVKKTPVYVVLVTSSTSSQSTIQLQPSKLGDEHVMAVVGLVGGGTTTTVAASMLRGEKPKYKKITRGFKVTYACEHQLLMQFASWRPLGMESWFCKECNTERTIVEVKHTLIFNMEFEPLAHILRFFRLKNQDVLEEHEVKHTKYNNEENKFGMELKGKLNRKRT